MTETTTVSKMHAIISDDNLTYGRIIDHLKIQFELNCITNKGTDWLYKGLMRDGINFSMAAIDELWTELRPSAVEFKWWAKTAFERDLENSTLELVDILHFTYSEMLVSLVTEAALVNSVTPPEFVAMDKEVILQTLIDTFVRSSERAIQAQTGNSEFKLSMEDRFFAPLTETISEEQSNMMMSPQCVLDHMARLNQCFLGLWAKRNNAVADDGVHALLSLLNLSMILGVSSNTLYSKYSFKAVLNLFRQNNGYKQGTYKKMWGDVEDNVHLMYYAASMPNASSDEIYKYLEVTYEQVLKQSN